MLAVCKCHYNFFSICIYISSNPDKYLGFFKNRSVFSFLLLVRSRAPPPVHVYPPRRTLSAAPWTYMSGGRFLTSSQFLRVVRPVSLSNLQHIIYYITWFKLFSQSSSGVVFSVVVQNFHSRFGFTEMSTMLKICMAYFVLFLFTYAHG